MIIKFFKKNQKLLKQILKLLVAILIIIVVYKQVQSKNIWAIVQEIKPQFLLLAIAAFSVSKLFSSIRLTHYLRNIGINVSFVENTKLYWLGMFYNLFMPGGIGGDGYKVYFLQKQYKHSKTSIIKTLLLDRLNGLFSLVLSIIIITPLMGIKHLTITNCVVLGVFSFVTAWLFLKFLFKCEVLLFYKLLVYSFGVQIMQIVSIYYILKSLNNISVGLEFFYVFLASSFASAIPVTPGGIGLREWTYEYASDAFGYDLALGVLTASLFFLISAISSLLGVYYHFNISKLSK